MTELRTTHTSVVSEDQIDHLGHMNVRFYAVNAHAGTEAMLADLPGWRAGRHLAHDLYTRHHREQLVGTPLVVRSAVLGASPAGVRLHHELAAADSGVLAATFVHVVSPVEAARRLEVPAEAVAAASQVAVDTPAYAATRSISLGAGDLMGLAPTLDEARARDLAMRKQRRVTTDECDRDGSYRPDMLPMLTWGGEPIGRDLGGQAHETADGKLMAWASMETRAQVGSLPRVGTRIQSFGAGIAIHDKVTHRIHWCFDLDTGELIAAFEAVSLAFDIRSRRPMSIPDGYRRAEEERLQPDLAPEVPA